MTKGEDFMKRGKCKNNPCSTLSKSAWCDLNSKGNILLKLHDKCPNPKSNDFKKSLLSHHINVCLRVDQLEVNCKKF